MVLIHQVNLTEEDRAKLHDLRKAWANMQHEALHVDISFCSQTKGKAMMRLLRLWKSAAQQSNASANAIAKKGWILPSMNYHDQVLHHG
jgi:hypothetical protein